MLKDIEIAKQFEVSFRSRYFNMLWFKKNRTTIDRILNFKNMVYELMDNEKYRVTHSKESSNYRFKLWDLAKKSKPKVREVVISRKGNVLNIRKRHCIHDPFIFVIAIRFGFIEIENNWETVKVISSTDGYKHILKKNMENSMLMLEITDKFYNRVKVPLNRLKIDIKSADKIQKIMNLKQYKKHQKKALRCVKNPKSA